MPLQINEQKFEGYKRVVQGLDPTTGFEGYIAIHNTNLGPALGGCRAMSYDTPGGAIKDVLNLAKGMTYKSALAGLNLGGGKSVINTKSLTKDQLKSFAELLNAVNSDGMVYTTAGDIGTGPNDLDYLGLHTEFVNLSGSTDSGLATAYGVFKSACGALEATERRWGPSHVSITGLGKVGQRLAKFVDDQGPAALMLSDINKSAVLYTAGRNTFSVVDTVENAHKNCDVYMPCAVGGTINPVTVRQMDKGTIICGAANNQLAGTDIELLMIKRDITYVPDYLANAGGVIIVSQEGERMVDLEYTDPQVKVKLDQLAETTKNIILESRRTGTPTSILADDMAERRFMDVRNRVS